MGTRLLKKFDALAALWASLAVWLMGAGVVVLMLLMLVAFALPKNLVLYTISLAVIPLLSLGASAWWLYMAASNSGVPTLVPPHRFVKREEHPILFWTVHGAFVFLCLSFGVQSVGTALVGFTVGPL